MNNFTLHLQSPVQCETLNEIESFTGYTRSGSFSILANHQRMMASLTFGLSWIRYPDNRLEYIALPGGILYFNKNTLTINTRHFIRNEDYRTIINALQEDLVAEEENIKNVKKNLRLIDEEILKSLWELTSKYKYETRI